MNDKKYDFLTAIAQRLPSDGSVLKHKDVASIVTESQWKSCYKWFESEAGSYVHCEKNHLSLKSGQTIKDVLELLKGIKDEKENKARYSIRVVAAMLDVPASTLRFWEDVFDRLEPERTPSGQRRYTPENVEVCKLIKHLLRDKGYSLEYAKKELEVCCGRISRHVAKCSSSEEALRLLREVAKISNGNPLVEARIKAVERWISSIEIAEEPPRPPHKNIGGKEYFLQEK